jgi:hypothetical protein
MSQRMRSTSLHTTLTSTRLLDFTHPLVEAFRKRALVGVRGGVRARIKALHKAVAALPLGYNRNDDVPASEVLRDRYGQCNTKAVLLMALSRGSGIPARLHAYRLPKSLQRGRHAAWLVWFMPRTTLFFWPEFFVGGKWRSLSAVVFDQETAWSSCPFDGACSSRRPAVLASVQSDEGVWNSPDDFFAKQSPTVTGWRRWGFVLFARRLMNARLASRSVMKEASTPRRQR